MQRIYLFITCAFLLLSSGRIATAQTTYHVQVNTFPLSGQTGNLDLQFNPGGADALDSTLTIANFLLSGGSLAATSTDTGGAIGVLPGPPLVFITNSGSFNDLFQGITFGKGFSFDAIFNGAALNPVPPLPTSGSVFALSLYDDAGTMPLLTTSVDGALLHIDINPDGNTSVTQFAADDGAFYASADQVTTLTPETGSCWLFASGMLSGIGSAWRNRKRKRLPRGRFRNSHDVPFAR